MQWRRRRQRRGRGRGHLPPSPCSRSSSPLESGTRWAQKQIEFVPFPLSSLSRWRLLGTSSLPPSFLSIITIIIIIIFLLFLLLPLGRSVSPSPACQLGQIGVSKSAKEGRRAPSPPPSPYVLMRTLPSFPPSLTDLLADGVTSLARQGRGDRRNGSAQKRRAEWRNRESRWRRVSDAADLIRCWTRRRARVRNEPRAIWPASDGARA